ncbi:MAG TPA: DUF4197 domain-containing protein [Quisquiliibacterium sp.]|nr:DUF4197 domain-containing protein [Quisquiliibacterium sp.]HQP66663.1 DUF4197 domain-containing protein [Quisquiliibacterium sp.]
MARPLSRQHLRRLLLKSAPLAALPVTWAAHAEVSQSDAGSGVRTMLEKGAIAAVESLGVTDGFLGNPAVRIPLPDSLKAVRGAARLLGMDKQFDELEVGINRAAEAAVPQAKALLIDAARKITLKDALAIVRGGDDSVTRYFESSAGPQIRERFLPIVSKSIGKLGLTQKYDRIASQAGKLGLVREEQSSLDRFVTGKAVDGLFLMIAEKERALRADPIGSGSAILKKVFGGS